MIGRIFRAVFSSLRDDDAVQTVSVKGYDNLDRHGIERNQDYGFAAAPPGGQGLVIEIDGHMFALRLDLINERPVLNTNEVCVWHKEGHKITLRDGKAIDVDCDEYNINTKRYKVNASESVKMDAPVVEASRELKSKTLEVTDSAKIKDIDFIGHGHDKIRAGDEISGGPVNR